jgi:hypothetical protein
MPKLSIALQKDHIHYPIVDHFLREVAARYNIELVKESLGVPLLIWGDAPVGDDLELSTRQIRIPAVESALIPEAVEFYQDLPIPTGGHPKKGEYSWIFSTDLLSFLCGQLYRAEELLPQFKQQASAAEATGFLGERFQFFDRPIVDLWMLELLKFLLGGEFSQIEQNLKPQVWLTHDIDEIRKWTPVQKLKFPFKAILMLLKGEFIKTARESGSYFTSLFRIEDPWYKIPDILNCNKDLHATFFFLGHPRDHKAYRYDIRFGDGPRMVQACQQQGHSLGLHGSPLHADHKEALDSEKKRIESVMIKTESLVLSRQHYLKITPQKTFDHLMAIGIQIDSTLGFNDRPGFRCGTCFPFRWYDLNQQRLCPLYEIPLILGDWQIHDPANFDLQSSLKTLDFYAEQVRKVGGVFTLLFHNIYFSTDYPGHADFYQKILIKVKNQGWAIFDPLSFIRKPPNEG